MMSSDLESMEQIELVSSKTKHARIQVDDRASLRPRELIQVPQHFAAVAQRAMPLRRHEIVHVQRSALRRKIQVDPEAGDRSHVWAGFRVGQYISLVLH